MRPSPAHLFPISLLPLLEMLFSKEESTELFHLNLYVIQQNSWL